MFARHMQARASMRNSAVVQGLKSLAARIHPQLPLTPRESQRLLAALTTSFREQLDKMHPRNADKPQNLGENAVNPGHHFVHSSAASADRHLASVLTNSLMVRADKPTLDYETAKASLDSHASDDPIKLLETYEKQGAANVAIAELCLATFKKSLEDGTPEKQHEEIMRVKPGARVLLWLLSHHRQDSTEYADRLSFQNLVVWFLVREGREESVWKWIQLDLPARAEKHQQNRSSTESSHIAYLMKRYRARGRIFASLIKTVVDHHPENWNHALHTLARGLDLAMRLGRAAPLPLTAARSQFFRTLSRRTLSLQESDPAVVDHVLCFMKLFQSGVAEGWGIGPVFLNMDIAWLHLCHPAGSSVEVPFEVLKQYIGPPRENNAFFKEVVERWGEAAAGHVRNLSLLVTAHLLKAGRTQDAMWAMSRVKIYFPRSERYDEIDVQRHLHEARVADRARATVAAQTPKDKT